MSYKPIPITTKLAAMRAESSAVKNLNKGYGLTPDSSLKQTEEALTEEKEKPKSPPPSEKQKTGPEAPKEAEAPKPKAETKEEEKKKSGMMESIKKLGESKMAEASEKISDLPGMGGKKAKRQARRQARRSDRLARKVAKN